MWIADHVSLPHAVGRIKSTFNSNLGSDSMWLTTWRRVVWSKILANELGGWNEGRWMKQDLTVKFLTKIGKKNSNKQGFP